MICDAISAGGSDKDIIKQLVEKLNIIFSKAFVNAQYNKDNEEFEFRNYYGAEVGNVEFPFIVKDASYDKNSERIIVTFKDDTIDPVEVDMGDLVSLINYEATARGEEDQKLWDAIGEMGASGTSLMELIAQEVSARTEGDEDIWYALNQEISARTDEDEKIWETIGEVGASGVNLVEMIENEISARTEGDDDLLCVLNQEIYARTDADSAEEAARTEADKEIKQALSAETEAREDNDSWLNRKLDKEILDRTNERIVIEYTVNGTRKEDVYVPVHDLIEEWRTEDGNVGAIALTKDVSIPEVDVLKARLILNTAHGDNAAIIDDNALYVSKNAIVAEANAEIEELKARVTALESALSAATQEHTTQSQRIIQVEQKNASQDDQISEISTKNQSQDQSIQDLLEYINNVNVNNEP